MSTDVINVEKSDGLAIVTLNRPQAMNALSGALRTAIAHTFEELEADPNIRVAVLTGAGKAFCAGLDLKELGASADGINSTVTTLDPVTAIGKFKGPVIGAINGVAITGGFELALACDVLIASTQARFADTHARVGILPGWGLSQKLSRLIGIYRAKEASLTGNFIDAATAERWGLVNRVVEPDILVETAVKLARDMLTVEPSMLAAYKKLIDEGFGMNFQAALAHERQTSSAANAKVGGDAIEARRAAIQERGKAQTAG
jgi:enoyl-CoA hydratase